MPKRGARYTPKEAEGRFTDRSDQVIEELVTEVLIDETAKLKPHYRLYRVNEKGELVETDEPIFGPHTKNLLLGMSLTKEICLLIASRLGKNWVWNENYPSNIAEKVAGLVIDAMETA